MSIYSVVTVNRGTNTITNIRKQTENGCLMIPHDEANTDYQAYLAWVAEGNTAEEWQPDGE